jgi:hypothetical protein
MKIYFLPNFIVQDKYTEISLSAVMCCGELLGGEDGETGKVEPVLLELMLQ